MKMLVKLIACIALLVSNAAAAGHDHEHDHEHDHDHDHDHDHKTNACHTQYIIQPPTALNCDPMGDIIALRCNIHQDSGFGNVTWYWSQCVHDAGVNGTAILPGDRSDAYGVQQILISGNITSSTLLFLVTNATLGYYWCEVSSASSRPSIITPVLQPNTSLPECMTVNLTHNFTSGLECADKGSPIVYPRVPVLPSFCPSKTAGTTELNSPTPTPDIPSETMPLALTATVTLLVVFGAFIIILVLIIVILGVSLCYKNIQSESTTKGSSSLEMHDKEELTKA